MDTFSSPLDNLLVADNWPMSLEATRNQLRQAQIRLERYRAALRLAGVEIERRNRSVIDLTAFAYQANRAANSITLLKLALVQALKTTGAAVGAVVLIDPETKELMLNVHKGLTSPLMQILTGQQLNYGATALMPHLVAGNGALLEYKTSGDDEERLLLMASCLTSLVSLPLQLGAHLLGALLVGLQEERSFTSSELCFLMALSQETTVALENLRLREGLWHTAETLLVGEATVIELQQETGLELNTEVSVPFDLPAPPAPPLPQPAANDLEQLLAAMMEAEDEVQQQNTDLQTLNTIAEMMNRTLNLPEILQCAVEQTQAILQTDAAWLYLVDEDQQLNLRTHTGLSTVYVRGMQRLKWADGLEGRAAADSRAYFVDSIAQETHAYKIWVDKEGLQSMAAVPLIRPSPEDQSGPGHARVIGVLATGRRMGQVRPWSPREIRLLTSIAHQVALVIDNAKLYARLQEEEICLRHSNQVLIELNDMLLKKNAALDSFIQDDLLSALTTASLALNRLSAKGAAGLTESQHHEVITLRKIVHRVAEMAQKCAS
ncbi:MAG: hypothetical protein DPW09_04835 [Anaerolineae bacterium]|nr:hypothetical protein [Anaerolineae bacterium]